MTFFSFYTEFMSASNYMRALLLERYLREEVDGDFTLVRHRDTYCMSYFLPGPNVLQVSFTTYRTTGAHMVEVYDADSDRAPFLSDCHTSDDCRRLLEYFGFEVL